MNVAPGPDRAAHPIVRLVAAHGWTEPVGLVCVQFQRCTHGIVRTYAQIENVPADMVGRAIVVWCLAHPWRLWSIARMAHAYVRLARRP